ncbi:MAG: hypothetical protein ACNA8W_01920 [Bradymonadaceae bacterium]
MSLLIVGCGKSNDEGEQVLRSSLGYDEGESQIVVIFNRALESNETLHVRVRSLAEGDTLDCDTMTGQIPVITESRGNGVYGGPRVDERVFENPTTPETLMGESPEGYQLRMASTFFVDVCVRVKDTTNHQARYDIRQALDRKGSGGKFDGYEPGVRIVSNQAYAEACIDVLGDIPFWGERISEDGAPDWKTIDCTEIGTPIPSTIDGVPQETHTETCDNPQFIYSHCEPDARTGANGPRVAHARNEQGSHWVLLCRKALTEFGRYEDMAMIGHNPFTGETCFFQNQLPPGEEPRPSNNAMRIPHPADNVQSEESPEMWSDLWGGIEGGIGPEGGIQCMGCHSTDPFIHTPWISEAKDERGNPIVPKMGYHPDFVEGYNGPYSLLNAEEQGWREPKILVSEEAQSCTSCHRIALDQWTAAPAYTSRNNEDGGCVFCPQSPWLDRLEQGDDAWERLVTESHKSFDRAFWMPPNAGDVLNHDLWDESDFKKSMDFVRMCGADPSNPACVWDVLPKKPGDPTELPEVEETGRELAAEALASLGAPYVYDGEEYEATRRCGECHAMSRFGFREWRTRTNEAIAAGVDVRANIDELTQEEALERVNFLRDGGEDSVFAAYKLGVFSPGVQFPYFQKLFQTAYGADWGLQYGAFMQRVSMPKGSHPPLSGREFAVLTKWFVDENLEHLDELVPEIPPPASCEEVRALHGLTAGAAPWLQNHVQDMAYDGWGARNEEAGINMFGCTNDKTVECFADREQRTDWETGDVDGARLLAVREFDFRTSFWTRASADGRFIGNGGSTTPGFGATITDLVTGRDIGVKGSYDPGFFPNNGGFIMQGSGAGLCGQSVLTREDAIENGIDFTEPGCSKAQGINLYQHVAVSLDGGDYFIINSEFTSDSGTGSQDPRAPFYEGSTMKFTPLVFDGSTWEQKDAVVVKSPYEGDSVLSPSGRLVTSRYSGPENGKALGHMIRRVRATPNASGSYDIDIGQPVQFLCEPGAKSNISFNERWSTTHAYEDGVANIYLSDLLTTQRYKVTNMTDGKKALFPHFRSDGWLYFLVSNPDGNNELIASDMALVLESNE